MACKEQEGIDAPNPNRISLFVNYLYSQLNNLVFVICMYILIRLKIGNRQ